MNELTMTRKTIVVFFESPFRAGNRNIWEYYCSNRSVCACSDLCVRNQICVCVKKSVCLYSDFQVKTNLQIHAKLLNAYTDL